MPPAEVLAAAAGPRGADTESENEPERTAAPAGPAPRRVAGPAMPPPEVLAAAAAAAAAGLHEAEGVEEEDEDTFGPMPDDLALELEAAGDNQREAEVGPLVGCAVD